MLTNNIPSFGPLQGVRVVHATQSIAGPYCACRMAEFGADVIWIENPKGLDIFRPSRWGAEIERRNMRSLCLDTPSEEGRKIFFNLLKTADIFIDSYRGGQMAKWGITDEVMHEVNPRLIICHISGFGQYGDPKYWPKASYDPIAQAYGCYMIQNGYPDRKPVPAFPNTADYVTSLQTAYAAMAALYRREKTGKGEVIDSAQYECMISIQGAAVGTYLNTGKLPQREGCHSTAAAGYGAYTCKDGVDIYTLILGIGVLRNALHLFGLDYSDEIPKGSVYAFMGTPGGDIIENALQKFCDEHTALEVETIFNDNGIPCNRIFDLSMAVEDPHYKAREVFIEWENTHGDKIKGSNIFPKLTNEPCQVWRGLMDIGEDTPDILSELGYSAEEIAKFQADGVAVKK